MRELQSSCETQNFVQAALTAKEWTAVLHSGNPDMPSTRTARQHGEFISRLSKENIDPVGMIHLESTELYARDSLGMPLINSSSLDV
jgi:hypothetical protein